MRYLIRGCEDGIRVSVGCDGRFRARMGAKRLASAAVKETAAVAGTPAPGAGKSGGRGFRNKRFVLFDGVFFARFADLPVVGVQAAFAAAQRDRAGISLNGAERKVAFAEAFRCAHASPPILFSEV
jgi:hypothetical protein